MTDPSLEDLTIGATASFGRKIETSDVDAFAQLSGDSNPLHSDRAFAQRCGFRDRVVHGAFLAGLASRLVGVHLPGRRSFLLGLKLDFTAPTFPGETVQVKGTVISIHPAQRVVVLRLDITSGGETRARGSATVRVTE